MSYWEALLNLLYPSSRQKSGGADGECLLCQRPFLREQEAVCALCLMQVQVGRLPFCRVCGREQSQTGICSDCRQRQETFFQRAVSYGPYTGRMSELILKMKKERRRELLPVLAELMAEAYAADLFDRGIQCLVPVPMSREKRTERGFNQAEELAVCIAERVRVPLCTALEWTGASRRQAVRSRQERLQGLQAVLALNGQAAEVQGRVVCLVDDVYTTGATANACAKKLLEAGARAVYVLTAAR